MRLKSKNFEDGGSIPSEFTCDGRDISPQLSWEDAPDRARSFALSVTDPDAPGGTFIHWLVHDIPDGVNGIEKGGLPDGAKQVRNDFGRREYGGPCPPSGTHRYVFTLYALNTEHLEVANEDDFFEKVKEHTLSKAELMGLYKRK